MAKRAATAGRRDASRRGLKGSRRVDERSVPAVEVVRDEAIHIPRGDTRYTIDLDQATVDALERGICPEALSNRMHDLMSWRREAIRATTPERPR
jgi:hypothetical protein